MSTIGAILLAAGASSRLGRSKQLLNFGGEALVRRSARAAAEAGFGPVVVVVGKDAPAVREELADLEVLIYEHPGWHLGMGSSLRTGLQFLLEQAPAIRGAAVLVCDQLFVTPALLTRLVAAREAMNLPAAASTYAGTIGVPAYFDRSMFPLLFKLGDEQGAKAVFSTIPQFVAGVPFPEGSVDIDTPADLERWMGAGRPAFAPLP